MPFTTLISAAELATHLRQSNWVIVDCRFSLADTNAGRTNYQTAHIPNAYYAHLDEDLSGEIIAGQTGRHPLPSVESLITMFSSWGVEASTQVVAYDQGHGGIAARLWWMLQWLGHRRVAVLDGGWEAWEQTGGAVDSLVPSPVQGKRFEAQPKMDWIVDAETLMSVIKSGNQAIVDARAAPRYRGEEEPIDPIAGHIPSAQSFPFLDNLEEGRWRSKAELKARFKGLVDKGKQPIIYCGSGVTACHNLLSMKHAGLEMGQLYPGSWSEWITDSNSPISTL